MKPEASEYLNVEITETNIKAKVVKNIKQELKFQKEKKFPICNLCGLRFKENYNMKRHVEQKICQRNQTKCKHCRKKFDTAVEETMHVNKGTCLECPLCKTTSKSYSSFIQHRLRHNLIKKHSCLECGKSFHTSGDFDRHIRAHSGDKPFTCVSCNKSFSESNNLRAHQKRHNGEKLYQCTCCDKAFYTRLHRKGSHRREVSYLYWVWKIIPVEV